MKEESSNIIDNLEEAAYEPLEELIPSDIEPEEPDAAARAEEEVKQWKDRYLRQAAELENYKKRNEREKADFLRRSNESFVKDLLPVLDNLERALEHPGELSRDDPFYQGVGMIRDEIDKILKKHGLEAIEAIGSAFDPSLHEAIMQQVENEVPENTVLTQMQRGYTFQGRLLRPAMVVVSKKG